MTADDWKTVVLAFAALSAAVQWVLTFRARRTDQTWVETMKSEIRRDVEQNLKTHESRLRLQADLRIRAHERSWDLLGAFTGAAWGTYEAIVDYAMGSLRGGPQADEEHGKAHQTAYNALTRLATVSASLPPREGFEACLTAFRGAFRATNELTLARNTIPPKQISAQMMTIRDDAEKALSRAHQTAKQWNTDLWREATPAALVSASTGTSGVGGPG